MVVQEAVEDFAGVVVFHVASPARSRTRRRSWWFPPCKAPSTSSPPPRCSASGAWCSRRRSPPSCLTLCGHAIRFSTNRRGPTSITENLARFTGETQLGLVACKDAAKRLIDLGQSLYQLKMLSMTR
ncbi:uncharacterized protein LOC130774465 [Actinidia eriantha]|uniref:uncharacterized protein LOC130774465 n=1 Tax=Actinidia eriantha TaxID=165200 RepID=UPI0025884354|nr:uncharacterized protein LOC130774465 [Actinidia eriantha]